MRMFPKNVILAFAILIILSVVLVSCGKENKEEPKAEPEVKVAEQIDTLLNAENLSYLKDSINFIEFATTLKGLKVQKTNNFGTIEQYNKTADRSKMLIRLGMLYTDILYKRVVNGEVQTTEYDQIAQRYIKDLNLSTLITSKFGEYLGILTSKKNTEEQVNELKAKIQAEKYKIIETAKSTNEDFLVYFTFGGIVEALHLIVAQKDSKQFETIVGAVKQMSGKKQFPAFKFFNRILNFVSENPAHKEYKTYISKIQPLLDAINQKFSKNQKLTPEERQNLIKQIETMRNELLN